METAMAPFSEMVEAAVTAYSTTLTAAGDQAAFDELFREWLLYVPAEVTPLVGQTFLAGSLFAYSSLPGPIDFADEALSSWLDVVNASAVEYQATATNRIVGASTSTWNDVRERTVIGVREGLTNEELKEQIESITNYSEFRSDTIARTETVAAYNGGDAAGVKAFPPEARPVEKSWLAALDNRTRESHALADGQTVGIDETFDVGGVPMDRPHDPAAPPSEVVNCRCVALYLYPGDERGDGSVIEGDLT